MGDPVTPPFVCPLSERQQMRNVLIVGGNTALSYLASPVLYVDVMHTALMDELQKTAGREPSAFWSNMPQNMYMIFAAMPLLVAWAFPQIRRLKPILTLCYVSLGLSSAAVIAVLHADLPYSVKAATIILHGGVVGMFRTTGVAFEFEVLGVAVSEARRGHALGLAYGFGPVLAVFANLLMQLLLSGAVGPIELPTKLDFPDKFIAVFAYTVPVMLLAAFLCTKLIVPVPEHEPGRLPFLTGVFGGISKFLGRRVPLIAVISTLFVVCGVAIIANMTLYTGVLYGGKPSDTAGYQKAILYTCKVVMGLTMGWVLTWAAPRSAVLLSATAALSAVVFAFLAPPYVYLLGHDLPIFLLSFGLLGAGQLHGVYATNYILNCASRALMRKFMAFTMVMMLPSAFAGAIYGTTVDHFGRDGPAVVSVRAASQVAFLADAPLSGVWPSVASLRGDIVLSEALAKVDVDEPVTAKPERIRGYRMSFVVAAAMVVAGIALALMTPPRPTPEE